MADLGKVIKGLECCLSGPMQCEVCPYKTDADTSIPHCVRDLRENTITLLMKAQEPRIMMLDEMKSVKDYIPIWLECLEPAFLKFDGVVYHLLYETAVPNFDDRTYSKNWRCWTSRPTDEQRKAVKWDG